MQLTRVERVQHGTELVDEAGATKTEVVTAIQRVADIMGEISSASSEQSSGVTQMGESVTHMARPVPLTIQSRLTWPKTRPCSITIDVAD
jgi:hypothetical protein